jgi:hypothetical protein
VGRGFAADLLTFRVPNQHGGTRSFWSHMFLNCTGVLKNGVNGYQMRCRCLEN